MEAGYDGLLAVEIDHLHPDYGYDEHLAVRQSIAELRSLVAAQEGGKVGGPVMVASASSGRVEIGPGAAQG